LSPLQIYVGMYKLIQLKSPTIFGTITKKYKG
jgi:hypothetical protein